MDEYDWHNEQIYELQKRVAALEAALREIERGVPIHTASNIARRALEEGK